ncbi:hypothetical protein DWZ45_11590 [Clostridium sp. AF32-7AC]|nr:hypothetical protein DWZ45_11590 [Clostridium sp. AF32-7AC]
MRAQRVREAENRSKCRLPNGPLRAQPKTGYIFSLVLCDVGLMLVAEDMQVSRKAHGITP